MAELILYVLSLRYSSWSIRALLPLLHVGAPVKIETVTLDLSRQDQPEAASGNYAQWAAERLAQRRALGSVTGYFPVLSVGGEPIHEALAICEWVAEQYPEARLWPESTLARAQARALSAEMASNFNSLRQSMSCHVFARVPGFEPDGPTRFEIDRVFELLSQALQASGGPFLFGAFGIADAMYFPVMTRFETYGVVLPADLQRYQRALNDLEAVARWRQLARSAPAIAAYDRYIEELGGELPGL